MLSLSQVKFCAAECERQQSGEMSVYWMCCGFQWALTLSNAMFNPGVWKLLTHEGIQELGRMIEPKKNAKGYRQTPVQIGFHVIPADNIQHQMETLLLDMQGNDEPEAPLEFYKELETIHPFIDGNGRVGAIIYNYLLGTLDSPVAPPDVFHHNEL